MHKKSFLSNETWQSSIFESQVVANKGTEQVQDFFIFCQKKFFFDSPKKQKIPEMYFWFIVVQTFFLFQGWEANYRHLKIIDCLTAHVFFISTVNGCSKKKKKRRLFCAALVAGTINKLQQSIFAPSISMERTRDPFVIHLLSATLPPSHIGPIIVAKTLCTLFIHPRACTIKLFTA